MEILNSIGAGRQEGQWKSTSAKKGKRGKQNQMGDIDWTLAIEQAIMKCATCWTLIFSLSHWHTKFDLVRKGKLSVFGRTRTFSKSENNTATKESQFGEAVGLLAVIWLVWFSSLLCFCYCCYCVVAYIICLSLSFVFLSFCFFLNVVVSGGDGGGVVV